MSHVLGTYAALYTLFLFFIPMLLLPSCFGHSRIFCNNLKLSNNPFEGVWYQILWDHVCMFAFKPPYL